ncbi:MAG: type VI secretion system protein TssA [Oceanospirillaceae bacterium]|nr:type VI secretion system protein TssA [Oceanospirillaceae bacterium]
MSSSLDLNSLLEEISSESPAGDDLEYDPEFTGLFLAALEGEDKTLGDSSIAAEPVNWPVVSANAINLFLKTKDLRVVTLLVRAQLQINGLAGFANALVLLGKLLSKFWADVHPQLDPDDDNDPTLRVNTLLALCDRKYTLNPLMLTPLVECKGLGKFSFRDIQNAKGGDAKNDSAPDLNTIHAAFMEADVEKILANKEALVQSIAALKSIDEYLTTELGAHQAPDVSALMKVINDSLSAVDGYLAERGEPGVTVKDDTGGNPSDPSVSSGSVASTPVASGQINSREDAAKMMDKISEYYQKHEPSSPIPLFMRRAKRLSTLSYMDIVADLTPDGLKQAKNVEGDA